MEVSEMAKRFLILLWLPVIWVSYKFGHLDILVIMIFLYGMAEIWTRGPLTKWSVIAACHMTGFLLIMLFPKEEVWFLVLTVVFNDVGAYFSGKAVRGGILKKHPFPKISPNKTVGGYIFGIVAGTIAGVVTVNYFQLPALYQLLALIICFLAIAGDLLESKFKRFYGIKDSSEGFATQRLFFGHGGAYDRFDAISLACIGWYGLKLII